MKRLAVGILAHVDAGKTTLSEGILYRAGAIRRLGRVDHGDAYLDTHALEKSRGITIFSKQAILRLPGAEITLLDTPGHVDLSPEAERTLPVLDCAVLVVNGGEGVESHTRTLWQLLRRHRIPTFLFINKMDLPGAERGAILESLRARLGDGFVDLADPDGESLALCSEPLMEAYLGDGITEEGIRQAVAEGAVFPCCFGSALRLTGIDELLDILLKYAPVPACGEAFGAKVFKITSDPQGMRLTHMKITGGTLRVRSMLESRPDAPAPWAEKVTEIRLYSGEKYQAVEEAVPGMVCAVTGLTATRAGEGLGAEEDGAAPLLAPVMGYRLDFPPGTDMGAAFAKLRRLAEEEPQYRIAFDEALREIRVQVMGAVQLEVLERLLRDRFSLSATFSQGSILYRETIGNPVIGMGHFEPLRHYAEVHLLLTPGKPGSGLRFAADCPPGMLPESWQRVILSQLRAQRHRGVLTGSPLTDMKITLIAGKVHQKHTEGGDLREAACRALRQGLMGAENVLLEPWYDFLLEVPPESVGRAMTDLERMEAEMEPPEPNGELTVIRGSAPVAALAEYPLALAGYTRGRGKLACMNGGYRPCPEALDVIARMGYDPEADLLHPADSIFCSHGAGHGVHWSEAPAFMHIEGRRLPGEAPPSSAPAPRPRSAAPADDEELMRIFERTYGPVKNNLLSALRPAAKARPEVEIPPVPEGPSYLLVDGYNIIFAWDALSAAAREDLELARSRLIHTLSNYRGLADCEIILVFDAYKVKGNPGAVERVNGISVVYTKEAETADMYIEKVTGELAKHYRVRVATSDRLEQLIILGKGAIRVPAAELLEEVSKAESAMRALMGDQALLNRGGMKLGEALENA